MAVATSVIQESFCGTGGQQDRGQRGASIWKAGPASALALAAVSWHEIYY